MDQTRADGGMGPRPPTVRRVSPAGLKRMMDEGRGLVLLDVREAEERAYCTIPVAAGAADLHIPLGQVPARFAEIRSATAAGASLVVFCHHGVRSLDAASWLAARGLPDVHNLDGGIDAWSVDLDPTVPRY